MLELIEVVSGRLISPKTWDKIVEIFEAVLDSPRTIWDACVVIYALNYFLVCMRPEMAMDFGFTKWNRGLTSGLPMDSPLLDYGTIKNSPGWLELDKKKKKKNHPCVVA